FHVTGVQTCALPIFRARGTIKGNGDETEVIDNILTRRREMVKSYGWYIRKYIVDTKAKGAIPIVCSLVARNQWKDGRIVRNTDEIGRASCRDRVEIV